MSDPAPRRRLPRFSLRSLILFVLLAGSGYGLWARWEPWMLTKSEPVSQTPSPNTNFMFRPKPKLPVSWKFSDREVHAFALPPHWSRLELRIARTDVAVWKSPELRWRIYEITMPDRQHLKVITGNRSYEFDWPSAGDSSLRKPPNIMLIKTAHFFKRRRPEYWYGVTWLPEFWLTVCSQGPWDSACGVIFE